MSEEFTSQAPTSTTEPSLAEDTVQLDFGQETPPVEKPKPKKKKRTNPIIILLIWLAIIIVVVILGLIISAFIAGFSSVFEMIDWIIPQLPWNN